MPVYRDFHCSIVQPYRVVLCCTGEYKRLQCDKLPAAERESGLFRDEDCKGLLDSGSGSGSGIGAQ